MNTAANSGGLGKESTNRHAPPCSKPVYRSRSLPTHESQAVCDRILELCDSSPVASTKQPTAAVRASRRVCEALFPSSTVHHDVHPTAPPPLLTRLAEIERVPNSETRKYADGRIKNKCPCERFWGSCRLRRTIRWIDLSIMTYSLRLPLVSATINDPAPSPTSSLYTPKTTVFDVPS